MQEIFRRGINVEIAVRTAIHKSSISAHPTSGPSISEVAAHPDMSAHGASPVAAALPQRKKRKTLWKKLKKFARRRLKRWLAAILEPEFARVRNELSQQLFEQIETLRKGVLPSDIEPPPAAGLVTTERVDAGPAIRDIVVIGAGGHAKVVIELLRDMGERVAYCIARESEDERCLDVPVVTGDEHLQRLREEGFSRAFVAVGSNKLRHQLADTAIGIGFDLVNAVSPTAVISPSVRLGKGIAVMANAVINADSVVADLAIVNSMASIDHDCHIGRCAHVAPRCALAGGVRVGARALLGIGCCAIPGVAIGEDAVVGAGGVVTRDIPDRVTVVGNPAKREIRSNG